MVRLDEYIDGSLLRKMDEPEMLIIMAPQFDWRLGVFLLFLLHRYK